jgi:hypothetical protein
MGRRAPFNIKLMIQVLQFYVHNNLFREERVIQLLTSAGFSFKKWLFGKRLLMRRSYIVKKGNQGADSTWAPFEETTKGPSPPHAQYHEEVGWLRERER